MAKKRDFMEYIEAFRDAVRLVDATDNHRAVAVSTVMTLRKQIDAVSEKEMAARTARSRTRLRNQRLSLYASMWGFCEGYRSATGTDLRDLAETSSSDETPYSS